MALQLQGSSHNATNRALEIFVVLPKTIVRTSVLHLQALQHNIAAPYNVRPWNAAAQQGVCARAASDESQSGSLYRLRNLSGAPGIGRGMLSPGRDKHL